MIDYSTISNTSGAFPSVIGLNVTSPGAGDGTPWIKAIIDDLWGARQAFMNHAGLTPNAATEVYNNSQMLLAVQKIAGHPGEVIAWMGDAADPSATGIRLLPLNGQGVVRTAYPDLDTACYVGDSDNPTAPAFYHADDAAGTSRNTAGAYLILPDLRGYTIRGLDTTASVDPDGASRWIGDVQDWAIAQHSHEVYHNTVNKNIADVGFQEGTGASSSLLQAQSAGSTEVFADDIPTSGGTGYTYPVASGNQRAESRMTNSAARWCIRY